MVKKIGNKEMLVIDSHTHVWEKFRGQRSGDCPLELMPHGRAKQGDKVFQLLPPEYPDDAVRIGVLETYMENNDVDKAVIIQNPCYGDQREYVAGIVKDNPGKFVGIGLLDPRDKDNIGKEIDTHVKKYGFKGVKMEVPDTPFILDDPEYDIIWKKVLENNCLVLIDLGWGDGPYDYDNNIEKMRNVLKKYPDIKIVLPHLGVSRLWDEEQKYPFPKLQNTLSLLEINQENLWFDSSAIGEWDEHGEYPYPRSQEIIKSVKERWGMDRIMWGTDFPTHLTVATYKQYLDFIIKHCDFLTQDDLEILLGKNADKVYFQ
jgi:predicted TIM-barrel fold metal-dependent hydrolase